MKTKQNKYKKQSNHIINTNNNRTIETYTFPYCYSLIINIYGFQQERITEDIYTNGTVRLGKKAYGGNHRKDVPYQYLNYQGTPPPKSPKYISTKYTLNNINNKHNKQ